MKDIVQRINEEISSDLERELTEAVIGEQVLSESMTYDQLVAATADYWPTRLETVKYVKAHPPELVFLKKGDVEMTFCYKAPPSGSGKGGSGRPHYGSIVFFPNKSDLLNKLKKWWGSIKDRIDKFRGKEVPPRVLTGDDLRKLKSKVSCDCEDFLYRFEVANKSHGASDVQHSNGARPNITNPKLKPGICKHLLACLRYLTKDTEIFANEIQDVK
jgi:hypothetical protein